MERKPREQRRARVCCIWSGNLEDNAEFGAALYGAETWRTTQSVGFLYMERKSEGQCRMWVCIEWRPGGQRRVWVCFIWSGNLKDNVECGSALYRVEPEEQRRVWVSFT